MLKREFENIGFDCESHSEESRHLITHELHCSIDGLKRGRINTEDSPRGKIISVEVVEPDSHAEKEFEITGFGKVFTSGIAMHKFFDEPQGKGNLQKCKIEAIIDEIKEERKGDIIILSLYCSPSRMSIEE